MTFVTDAPALVNLRSLDVVHTGFFVSSPKRYCAPAPDVAGRWLSIILNYERFWLASSGRALPKLERHRETVCDGYHYWFDILKKSRPSIMLVWGSTAPLSRLHLKLCSELSIPTVILERGHFSGTLMVDIVGQFAFGGFGLQPQRALSIPCDGGIESSSRYSEWVKRSSVLPYASYNVDAISGLREVIENTDKKVVLFIGINDLGAGCSLSSFGSSIEVANPFASTRSGLMSVIEAMGVVAPTDILVFKPHPSDRGSYEDLLSDNFYLAKDVNINFLIENSDVCVSLSTTALARVVASEKPVVTLGFTELSLRDIAYECRTSLDVPTMLRAALYHDGFSGRVENGRAYIGTLFENYLVAFDKNTPCRFNMEDLSDFIVERVRHYE
ncbi:capsular polysaccharide export protein, LipB/KpsS family [Pseudomonas sp. Q1-7]|uniref:capsular polysaccharide export protein, LipB/KpsS family n=1 Tax=Pseudomonas sp. Q1-7 TaxID=3020843 RepID=UPI00230157AA|nr:hypothetical protein [Pseudomonas sp. Q1-7]